MQVEHEGVADYLRCRSYGPLRVFSRASCSWRSEGPFGQSFSVTPPLQALRGLPCLGSFSVAQRIRHIGGPPGWVLPWDSAHQVLDGPASLLFSCWCWRVGGRGYGDGSTPYVWLSSYHLASMAARLSSKGISHHSVLPHIPSISLSIVNSSPRPGIASQSLNFNS